MPGCTTVALAAGTDGEEPPCHHSRFVKEPLPVGYCEEDRRQVLNPSKGETRAWQNALL
jgi:hypothetical protein